MKNIHPETHDSKFVCASCGAKYTIMTTMKSDKIALDICAKCHPFYIGKTTGGKLKGRSEKLSSKFDAGKTTMTTKVEKKAVVRKSNAKKGLENL